jgi:hypothetical protein
MHLELNALSELLRTRQNLSTLESSEGGERTSVKPRVLKSEASVHRVSSELEGELTDIPLSIGWEGKKSEPSQ